MRRSLPIALILLLSACSMTPPDGSPRVAYREAESVQSLVVPPDLTQPRSPDALEIEQPGGVDGEVLPEFADIRMVRAGPVQWLEVDDADPRDLWPRMIGFLRSEGLTIRTQRPAEGLIETAWAQRYDGPARGGLGGFFQGLFGAVASDTVRDRYQIRLERLDSGGSRIFLTHWMAQEVNTNPNTRDTPILGMAAADADPAIAAEMRRRLLVYLGVRRQRASAIVAGETATTTYTTPIRLVVTKGGEAHVEIEESNFRRALGLVSEALGLIGAEVTEREEDKGNLWIRWLPPQAVRGTGLFSDDRPQRLLLKLEPADYGVRMAAGGADGNLRSGKVQVALLERLVDALGGDISSFRGVADPDEDSGSGLPDAPLGF